MPKYAIHICHDCLDDFPSDKLFLCTMSGKPIHTVLMCKNCMETDNRVTKVRPYKKNAKYMKEYFKKDKS